MNSFASSPTILIHLNALMVEMISLLFRGAATRGGTSLYDIRLCGKVFFPPSAAHHRK